MVPRVRSLIVCALNMVVLAVGLSHAQYTPSGDTYVDNVNMTATHGTSPTLTASSRYTTFVQFDLHMIPTYATVSQATLKLYVNTVTGSGGSLDLYPVNGPWSESTLNYSGALSLLGSPIAVPATPAASQYLLIDITSQVQGWVANPSSNNGVALTDVSGSNLNVSFISKENTAASHPPELDIVFGVQNATAGSGLTSSVTNGTLNLGLTSCGNNYILEFTGGTWTCVPAGSGAVTSLTVNSGLTESGGPSGPVTLGVDTNVVALRSQNNNFAGTQSFSNSIPGNAAVSASDFSGSPGGYGVLATSANGNGVFGSGVNGIYGTSATAGGSGVFGTGTTYGVFGETQTNNGSGVQGQDLSPSGGSGVYGYSTNNGGYGVYGVSTAFGTGVYAASVAGTGLYATTSGANSSAIIANSNGIAVTANGGVVATAPVVGVEGTSTGGAGTGVSGFGSFGVYGSGTNNGVFGYSTNNVGVFGAGGSFAMVSQGNFVVIGGGTKSGMAALPDDRQVLLYAMESPENWYEDFGSGKLMNGVVAVAIEPTFMQTVNTDIEYHVFLTPKGDCKGLYVANESPTRFEVRELGSGQSSVAFDYRIVAKRRGLESLRMEVVSTDHEMAETTRQQLVARSSHTPMLEKMPESPKPTSFPVPMALVPPVLTDQPMIQIGAPRVAVTSQAPAPPKPMPHVAQKVVSK